MSIPQTDMFTETHFFHIVMFSALVLIMPGPTNMLLLSSGAIAGFLRTLKLIAAELAGYFLAISIWGFILIGLSQHFPWLAPLVKLLAAGYVAWMAIKIWKIRLHVDNTSHIKGFSVFLTTLLNPKAFVFAAYIMPDRTFSDLSLYIPSMLAFVATLIPVSLCWSLLGKILGQKGTTVPGLNPSLLFRGASFVMCFFSFSLFYQVLH